MVLLMDENKWLYFGLKVELDVYSKDGVIVVED